MNTNTQEKLRVAREAVASAEAKVAKLEKLAAHEASFVVDRESFVVVRRCITTGRLENLIGVFTEQREAVRFAKGVGGYGLGKDIFIEVVTLYR